MWLAKGIGTRAALDLDALRAELGQQMRAEGASRVNEREVIRLARRNQVSIYPVYVNGYERSLFELLARQTGGASFNLRDMKKSGDAAPGKRVFQVVRGHYVLSVSGNLGLGEKLRVEVKRPDRLQVSAMSLE